VIHHRLTAIKKDVHSDAHGPDGPSQPPFHPRVVLEIQRRKRAALLDLSSYLVYELSGFGSPLAFHISLCHLLAVVGEVRPVLDGKDRHLFIEAVHQLAILIEQSI
jgi:hypothetical protein